MLLGNERVQANRSNLTVAAPHKQQPSMLMVVLTATPKPAMSRLSSHTYPPPSLSLSLPPTQRSVARTHTPTQTTTELLQQAILTIVSVQSTTGFRPKAATFDVRYTPLRSLAELPLRLSH